MQLKLTKAEPRVFVDDRIANPIEKVYDLVPGDDGSPTVAVVDEINVDEIIQAGAPLSADLRELAATVPGDTVPAKLKNLANAGVLADPVQRGIVDLTGLPKDKGETVMLKKQAEAAAAKFGKEGDDYDQILKAIVEDYKAKQAAKAAEKETKE